MEKTDRLDARDIETQQAGALLELGDGCRDLIDAGLRHALCLLQIVEILALDSLVLWVVPTQWVSGSLVKSV
jgi:hypothetical protein